MINIVDIVIRSWNAFEYTKLAVDTLRTTTGIPIKIIVVDDGSKTDNIQRLREISDIVLVEHGRNLGLAQVAITASKNISSEVAVLMDNDIIVQQGWLERFLPYFEDKQVAIVAPIKIHRDYIYPGSKKSTKEVWEEIKQLGLKPPEALSKFIDNQDLETFRGKLVNFNNLDDEIIDAPPGFVSGGLITFRKNAVEKVGGLARKIFPSYGGEDVDLCWRLGEAGYKIIKSCQVYAHHFEHSSVTVNNVDYKARLTESNKLLYKYWGEKVLEKKKYLVQKCGQERTNDRYPFISIFENIRLEGKSGYF